MHTSVIIALKSSLPLQTHVGALLIIKQLSYPRYFTTLGEAGGGGGAALNEVGPRPRSNPLPYYILFLTDKVSVSFIFS